ncbi:PREDICTED: trypsin 5G1-like [Papilio polytes]|uniref:trypsin 5G1-like n=1 Tax=Papilio polytes TaxID=76194 RepID=UPI00067620BC|nr:PREDICTED: trypsin 5G1-like [Papilio polytes]
MFHSFVVIFVFVLLIFTPDNVETKLQLRSSEIRRSNMTKLTVVEKETNRLYKILNETREFRLLRSDNSCEQLDPKMPNFRTPGRRISEVKCLELLWQIRFYDELLIRTVRCGPTFGDILDLRVIFGGDDAEPGDFPHMGAVGWKAVRGTWIFKCGSTLISDKFLLTAAHCTRAARTDTKIADPVPKIVRLGETNILDENESGGIPMDVEISRLIVHENYRSPSKYFDIALIELEESVLFTMKGHPACLFTNNVDDIDGTAFITGWGLIEADSVDINPKLQVAVVDLVDHERCDSMLKRKRNYRWRGLARHQLCAGVLKGGVDTCQGDSGGPLQMDIDMPFHSDWSMHFVAGITSFGYGCARANTPSVYIKVSSFIDWIESIVWEDEDVNE